MDKNTNLPLTSLFSFIVLIIMTPSASADEFLRLARNMTSPEMSASAFVGVVEQRLKDAGLTMSAPCRTELQKLMTKASVERLAKTSVLAKQAQMLQQHFKANEAQEISAFLESKIGPSLLELISSIAAGQARSAQAKQDLADSLFSVEERKRAVEFLGSSTGKTFQSNLPSIIECSAKIEVEFANDTMEILHKYSEEISSVMHKHGY